MALFVKYLRSLPVYAELCRLHPSEEGNLLERPASLVAAEAQVEFLRWAIGRTDGISFVETGTNKGMFGLLLANLWSSCDITLHTFCNEQASELCINALQNCYPHSGFYFVLGDSRETFTKYVDDELAIDPAGVLRPDFAWIDGGHEHAVAYSDIHNAMRLRCHSIAVDDTQYQSVKDAIAEALAEHPEYRQEPPHPWHEYDPVGAVLLTRTKEVEL